ncbi:MAG TPA: glycosyltransferase family 39 protein, partial [Candidatus Acidoferrales bacterium]|nr:glycosyltransferase family 39 protein [Candidatus Acidoferrales bacterium]
MHSSTRGPTPAARQALLVFGLALLLRLVFCFAIYPQIVEQFGQGDGYDVIARNLASGHGYTLPDIDAPAERLPLYPFLLAASFKLFGPADWPWQILQALIGAATCSLVYRLARHYASRSAALAVATVCVFHPSLLLFTARPLTETVYVLLTVLFAWAVLQRRDGLAGV